MDEKKLSHTTYNEVGASLAGNWGYRHDGSKDDFIKTLTDSQRAVCLLSTVINELREIHAQLQIMNAENRVAISDVNRSAAVATKKDSDSAVADGLKYALLSRSGDKPIDQMDKAGLSVRALKVLRKAGFTARSQINEWSLCKVKNCGMVTVNEIMNWARSA